MAARKTKRKRRTSAAAAETAAPGWVWMLFGLAIGLSVAFAVWVNERGEPPPDTSEPAARAASVIEEERDPPPREPPAPRRESRFDFYEMLPRFEVVVPEEEERPQPNVAPEPVDTPGIYVLQAGSFSTFEDADRMKAELALQGIESSIQRVSIDDRAYHRVRVGPTEDLERLNDVRRRLREARIEALLIRVGE